MRLMARCWSQAFDRLTGVRLSAPEAGSGRRTVGRLSLPGGAQFPVQTSSSQRKAGVPRGHWAGSGDVCGCHKWGAPGIKGLGPRTCSTSTVPGMPPQRTTHSDVSGARGDPVLII